ncbi:RNA polymerase factor sigma-54 [Campylobacter molothri]|uniref:RNA polymerase factor sigma-54 n=1 Tax=Campylobacter molothri TaxID=1032242 RepID=UPI001D814092|nr:RNA polymerase factor sigma-54 [Campylobacter sp. RM10537]MBZ7930211.1 RNA polymerase factor sigma-54 [Campylobacter sp. W0067]MBZ7934675.1 RNA polymerase factor sigma-54 [Campylobacter sp. W0065]MBZ7946855.1 RNA polymerase factor sigma-54 [Campylobacter sp. RM10536]MBZ7948426.1 RNA polymerase factor sigma-54 [Campylobacter sp. RM9929]MBZ7952821.1 RNA polymerase factor sigma-54 [Campylobacter sp. RM9939]MBZ7957229.1 RNA polymerase factor sigma-54 [Campylobacter sp. RM10541]MBZ7961455.1 RN
MLKQKVTQGAKTKISQTLRSWLPILQANIEDLKENLDKFAEENPFLNVQDAIKTSEKGKNYFDSFYKNNTNSAMVESMGIGKKSVYELLSEQIIPPLFPTKKSQNIANKIIECLNHEGYFEYDQEVMQNIDEKDLENIRMRFRFLDPIGVGAKDYKEAFLFALENESIDEELYDFCKLLILDFENIQNYTKEKLYTQAISVIKKFSIPPFLEYFEDSQAIIPDIFIFRENDEIKVKINDEYYPEISIETDGIDHEYLTHYIKEAKNLVDALAMRKATLYKIGLMIVEHQYDFFVGKDIKPMTLKDIAEDLDRNASTVSRAIANKYLSCERGLIPLKDFFAFALDEEGETSNASVKDFIANLVKNENRLKPLSDSKILKLIQDEFKIDIGRRTVTKYRKHLNIASSTDRKKLYELEG